MDPLGYGETANFEQETQSEPTTNHQSPAIPPLPYSSSRHRVGPLPRNDPALQRQAGLFTHATLPAASARESRGFQENSPLPDMPSQHRLGAPTPTLLSNFDTSSTSMSRDRSPMHIVPTCTPSRPPRDSHPPSSQRPRLSSRDSQQSFDSRLSTPGSNRHRANALLLSQSHNTRLIRELQITHQALQAARTENLELRGALVRFYSYLAGHQEAESLLAQQVMEELKVLFDDISGTGTDSVDLENLRDSDVIQP